MAQKVQVILVDDIDGGAADETVSFSLDGVSYEIDLSTKNACRIPGRIRAVRRHRPKGRRPVGQPRPGAVVPPAETTGPRRSGNGPGPTGTKVNERGRISATVVEAYDKAHS